MFWFIELTGKLLPVTAVLALAAVFAGSNLPGDGQLAFVSTRQGNYEIHLLDVSTALTANLTRSPSRDSNPVWSPDGARLAFVSTRDDQLQIFIADPYSGRQQQITWADYGSVSPTWSPDGRQIAYISYAGGQWGVYATAADCAARLICEAATRRLHLDRLPPGRSVPRTPSWSPDGRYVAFAVSGRDGLWNVSVIKLASGRMTVFPGGMLDTRLNWSRDSRSLLFASVNERNPEIYRLDVSSGLISNVSQSRRFDGSPDWSPDGHWIAFASNRDAGMDIYRMQLDGGDLQHLTLLGDSDNPIWSPDGRWIVFEVDQRRNRDLYLVSASGGAARRLTAHQADDLSPAWKPG